MKRSEMIEHIAQELRGVAVVVDPAYFRRKAADLLDMIEGFGMQPPTYAVSLDEDSRTHTTILMWEPEDEE